MAGYVTATLTAPVEIQLTSVVSITCMCNFVPGEINGFCTNDTADDVDLWINQIISPQQ